MQLPRSTTASFKSALPVSFAIRAACIRGDNTGVARCGAGAAGLRRPEMDALRDLRECIEQWAFHIINGPMAHADGYDVNTYHYPRQSVIPELPTHLRGRRWR